MAKKKVKVNLQNKSVKKKVTQRTFTEEDLKKRKEYYFMLLLALNQVKYCIAQIGVDTLKTQHQLMFRQMYSTCKRGIETIYDPNRSDDKEILQDKIFDHIINAQVIFGLLSLMNEEQMEWYLQECEKLGYNVHNVKPPKK